MQRQRLKDHEKAILDELREGDRTKGFLKDEIGRHRNTVYRALQRLEAAGYVDCIHEGTSLYSLENYPEDTA